MKKCFTTKTKLWTALFCLHALAGTLLAQLQPKFSIQRLADQESYLSLSGSAGQSYEVQYSSNLTQWLGWRTVSAANNDQLFFPFLAATNQLFTFTDPGATSAGTRFYRALQSSTNALSGDHLATSQGDLVIHGVHHAALVMSWAGKMIYPQRGAKSGTLCQFSRKCEHFSSR